MTWRDHARPIIARVIAEAERELDELRRAVWEQPGDEECDSAHAETLEEIHRCNRAAVQITSLTARLAEAEALLTTACDAWECGQMVWNAEGHLLADYKAACLPKAWYERAKGGRDE